ncbi:hypothetical protein ABLE68_16280 [Nocardioides sp. CN2-186]|uniref:hypothetical protein n=1 Tax=Nocardioides tweenelious TaxID=3156607 RepID=UPI0032B49A88
MKRSLVTMTALAIAALVAAPASAAAPTISLRPASIERGADATGPRVVGSTLRDGDVRVRLDWPNVSLLGTSGTAYVVAVSDTDGSHAKVLRMSPSGHTTTVVTGRDASNVLLSADGDELLSAPWASRKHTTVKAIDARTGDLVRKHTFRGSATVLAADTGRAVIGSWGPDRTLWWDYTTDETKRISKRAGYAADIAADRVASYTGDPYDDGCSVVTDLGAHPSTLWRSCDERVDEFSPDGSRVATVYILSDGIGPGRVTVSRTDGGKKLASYDVKGWFGQLRWESDTSLLLDTYGKKQWATIRCDRATCDRATRLRSTPAY